ncbi:MAG: YCF48-related protein [Bacteroidales bacterium]|nr:YCF48-related protein [Bacteroidales bacterium]
MIKHLLIASVFLLVTFVSQAQTWEKINTGTTLNLWCSCFIDSTHGWIAGGTGGTTKNNILKTTDGGLSFTTYSTGYYSDISGFSAVDMNNAWAADGSIIIRHTSDGGTTWINQTPGPSPTYPYNLLRDVFFKDVNNGWTVGDNGTIYRTKDGGTSWVKAPTVTSINLKTVFFATINDGWAGGDFASVLRTNDGGASWTVVVTPTAFGRDTYGISDLFFADASRGWAAISGAVLRTGDGGNTWIPESTSDGSNGIFFTNDDGWAVGSFGVIFRSGDGGVTWTIHTDIGDAFLYSVSFPDADHGWITGSGGTLYQYKKQGTTSVSEPVTGQVFSLDQNYPNPFFLSTTIQYQLPRSSFVKLTVYNIFGQQVAKLVNEQQQAGKHEVELNGSQLTNGTYFYRLQAGEYVKTKKIVVKK